MTYRFSVPELQETPEQPEERNPNEPVFDALNAGVAPGGLVSKSDIKVLLCYLLQKVGDPVPRQLLAEVMLEKSIANYFEVLEAVSELIDNGNIREEQIDGEDVLTLTERGSKAVDILESDIPKTVRETALKSLVHTMTLERNAKENDVAITKREDGGYDVSFVLKDRNSSMMDLKIYVADYSQAEMLKEHFSEDPVRIYSSLLAALMVD